LLEEEESLKNLIKSHMGNAGKLISQEGEELASFKSPKPKVKTNYKAIVEDFREILKRECSPLQGTFHTVEHNHTKGYIQSRRFLLKAKY